MEKSISERIEDAACEAEMAGKRLTAVYLGEKEWTQHRREIDERGGPIVLSGVPIVSSENFRWNAVSVRYVGVDSMFEQAFDRPPVIA